MIYQIGQLADIIDGDRGKNYPKQNEFFPEGYCLFLNAGNVTPNGFSFEENSFITQEKDDLLRKGKLQRGDIVYTTRGTVGNAALYSESVPFENIRINSGMVILRCHEDIVDKQYLYQVLKSEHFRPYFKKYCTGSAQPQLPIINFSKIELNIPEVATQRRIADILSAYDDLIENNRKQIKLLEEAAQRLYKEWFVDLLFPGHEHTKIVDGVPEGWGIFRFSDKVKIMSGGTPKTDNSNYYGGEIPFYTPKDSGGAFFAFQTETNITEKGLDNCNSHLYPENTIIITARGTVGKTTLLAVPMAMNQSCYALKSDEINAPYYLFFALNQEIIALRTMSNGGVFNTIVVKTFYRIHIRIPPDNLIQRFENMVTPVMELIKAKTKENFALSEARDRLLPELMSGEVEV